MLLLDMYVIFGARSKVPSTLSVLLARNRRELHTRNAIIGRQE